MKLLLPHDNTDFDAFASLFAARLLHPDGVPVLGRRLQQPVRDYLGLHRDLFDAVRFSDVDAEQVRTVVLVDTRKVDRLPPVARLAERLRARDEGLEVHIYDHHPSSPDDAVGTYERIEPVGAAVTLLIEELRNRGQRPTAAEATLFALGIYADTGSLRFVSTTGRDAAAVSWLLDHGANLQVVNQFTRAQLGPEQRLALAAFLGSVESIDLGCGVRVGVIAHDFGRYIGGLATVVRHVLELEGHDAVFGVFPMGRQGTQVIGRSAVPHVDVARVLESFGGGGHQAAAAARLRTGEDDDILGRLRARLGEEKARPLTVGEVMSSPVRTVPPDLPLTDLDAILTTLRHTGVPVVKDGALVGIISRRDVEAARRDGRLHLPVSSCMTHGVSSVSPDAPLRDALTQMGAANVGRLPVLRDNHIVGILSRSDAMRMLYGSTGR